MNHAAAVTALAALLACNAVFAQAPAPVRTIPSRQIASEPGPPLTKFDLDFAGGTPSDLVRAIEKASGKPLNAIVPDEFSDVRIPALKLRQVDVAELFQALTAASRAVPPSSPNPGQPVYFPPPQPGYGSYGSVGVVGVQSPTASTYGFSTQGPPRDDSIWYFYATKPQQPAHEARTCRFWQLGPYLETYDVAEITNAIHTGYTLLGVTPPAISFQKETRLLIGVGEQSKLYLVDEALKQLQPTQAPSAKKVPGPARSAEPKSAN